ncbi:MAG: hypothetical protein HEP71_22295 [Roseivirga sp.]|nr:hypothetical protein [Roseivirga sp.]
MTFKESHLFKDNTANVSNYYKLNITGNTFLSRARYVSGYYDEKAVLEYFGEFSQPDTSIAVFLNKGQKIKEGILKKAEQTELEGPIEGKKLVMILSANSKGVSDQIGSIAESQQLLNAFNSLASKDNLLAFQKAKSELSQKTTKYDQIDKRVALMLHNLDSANTSETNEVYLVSAVNMLLDELGYDNSVKSISELEEVLKIIQQ